MKYVSCKSQMFTQVNETPGLNNVKQWRQFSTWYLPWVLALSVWREHWDQHFILLAVSVASCAEGVCPCILCWVRQPVLLSSTRAVSSYQCHLMGTVDFV